MDLSSWMQSIAQNLAASATWAAMGVAYGVMMAILKKKQSPWFVPALYGLISGSLVMIVSIALTVGSKWPRGGPPVLAAIVLITVLAHWFIARKERESVSTARIPDHEGCEKRINNLEGQIFRLEKENTTRGFQLSARQSDLDTAAKEIWKEQKQSESLRGEIKALETKLDTFSVPNGQLQLIEARYFVPGEEESGLDVLKVLQSDIDNRGDGKLWLGVDEAYQHHFRPDPHPRVQKFLRIDYLHRGKRFSVTVPEDTIMVLPLPYKRQE